MATHQLYSVIRHLRRLTGQESGGSSDAQLLERWITRRDDAAFEVLVWRHGPMVLSLTRQLLGNAQDAEDAFQATFLTLVRKATSIGKREAVGSWLYKVAYRVALAGKNKSTEPSKWVRSGHGPGEPDAGVEQRELQQVMREEVNRLPEKYRAPVVLCHLEGKTHLEAADELGWAKGTVSTRLTRARDLLRTRLVRRGLGLSAGGVAAELSLDAASANVHAALAAATVRAAGVYTAKQGAAGVVSTNAVALAEGVMRAMFISKLKVAALVALTLGIVALGTGLVAQQAHISDEKAETPPPVNAPEIKEGVDLHSDPLPPGAIARLGTMRFRHAGFKNVVGFSSDGKNILTCDQQSRLLRVWDPVTGQMIRQSELSSQPRIHEVYLGGGGKTLVSVGNSSAEPDAFDVVCLWSAATGKEVRRIKLNNRSFDVGAIAITSDGKTLAYGQKDGSVHFVDIDSGAELLQEKLTSRAPEALVFSPDNQVLAVTNAGHDFTFYLWEWDAGKKPRSIKVPESGVDSIAFAPDGKKLVTSREGNGSVRLWDVASGRLLHTWKRSNWGPTGIAYSPDGKMVAGVCNLRTNTVIAFWDPDTGKELHRLDVGIDGASRVAFSPDSKRVVVGNYAVVRVWDVDGWKELGTDEAAHRRPINRIAFSPRDGLVVTASEDSTVRVWDTGDGRQRFLLRHDSDVTAVTISPDGKRIASSAPDDTVRVWDIATSKETYKLAGHGETGGRRALRFSPDSKRLISWGDPDTCVRVWDMTNGKALLEHEIRPSGAFNSDDPKDVDGLVYNSDATLSPDGKTLVLVKGDGPRIFAVESGKEILHIPNEDDHFYSVAISPDGKSLLAGAAGQSHQAKNPDGTIRIVRSGPTVRVWDMSTGKLLLKNVLPDGWIGQVAFTPDGKSFAAICHHPAPIIRFWDTNSGDETRVIEGVPSRGYCFAFSPDGKQLAVGLEDTTALVYDLTRPVVKPKTKGPQHFSQKTRRGAGGSPACRRAACTTASAKGASRVRAQAKNRGGCDIRGRRGGVWDRTDCAASAERPAKEGGRCCAGQ